MEDWHDCNDPAELHIRLDVALEENAELRTKLAALRTENQHLRTRLGMPTVDVPQALPPILEPLAPTVVGDDGELPYADSKSGTEAKIALFRALFAGREDIYATRWVSAKSGRTGWSPAEDNPFAKNKNDAERVFWPLTDKAIYNHLSRPEPGARETHLGLYPLLADDTCRPCGRLRRQGRQRLARRRGRLRRRLPRHRYPRAGGGLPFRGRRARMGLLHGPCCRSHRPHAGNGTAAPRDRRPRADDIVQL
ncbi:hypothetical protein SAMN05216268_1494 [Streptomyces yunnanensis]|uniref:TOTE conflict system primase domain-containing protein n=1 Tax=Streptomyces yunnanensis TaxID=156453 RepID=A0A9X8R0H7_9ACTN|nr:hypothetical protein [Streptomyces yunnanensis]SHN34816.1 hypothetical protein SAMN05216268_1494 [Streptomyces yunnanensis]